MKKILIWLVLITPVLLLKGCGLFCDSGYECCDPNTKLVRLNPAAREWVSDQRGQQLLFENGSRQMAGNIIAYTDTVEGYFQGAECPDGRQEAVTSLVVIGQDTIEIRAEFTDRIALAVNGKGAATYVISQNQVYPSNDPDNFAFADSLTVASKPFISVLKGTCSTCNKLGISRLYVSRAVGLVAFQRNDTLWTLQ